MNEDSNSLVLEFKFFIVIYSIYREANIGNDILRSQALSNSTLTDM